MKKLFMLIFVLIICISIIATMFLAGCKTEVKEITTTQVEEKSNEVNEKEEAKEEVTVEPVTIRVMTFFAHDNPEVERGVVAAFEEANPNITVKLEEPSYDDLFNTLTADIAAGTPPDVVSMNFERLFSYAGMEALEPLNNYVSNENYNMDIYYKNTVDMHTINNVLYGLPATFSNVVLYYNKDMFDKAGIAYPDASWDWDMLVKNAKQFVKDTNGDGITDVYGYGPAWWPMYLFLFDTNLLTPDNSRCAMDTPQGIKAIQEYVDLQLVHGITANIEAQAAQSDWDRFIAGNLAMYQAGPWAVKPFNDNIKDFVWDITDNPRGTVQGTFLYSNSYAITSGSQNKDAAWEFIKFATGSNGSTIRQKGQYEISTVKSIAESIFIDSMEGQSPAHPEIFMSATSYGKKLSQHPSYDEILDAIQAELDLVLTGKKTVSDAMTVAAKAVNAIIEDSE